MSEFKHGDRVKIYELYTNNFEKVFTGVVNQIYEEFLIVYVHDLDSDFTVYKKQCKKLIEENNYITNDLLMIAKIDCLLKEIEDLKKRLEKIESCLKI